MAQGKDSVSTPIRENALKCLAFIAGTGCIDVVCFHFVKVEVVLASAVCGTTFRTRGDFFSFQVWFVFFPVKFYPTRLSPNVWLERGWF